MVAHLTKVERMAQLFCNRQQKQFTHANIMAHKYTTVLY